MDQRETAKNAMISWLSHPGELGKVPDEIELTKEFDYLDMKYYIFKYKKNFSDTVWLLSVCGGYEPDSEDHCGHVFSDFKEYKEENEVEDAVKIIEMIRAYWIQKAKDMMKNKK